MVWVVLSFTRHPTTSQSNDDISAQMEFGHFNHEPITKLMPIVFRLNLNVGCLELYHEVEDPAGFEPAVRLSSGRLTAFCIRPLCNRSLCFGEPGGSRTHTSRQGIRLKVWCNYLSCFGSIKL